MCQIIMSPIVVFNWLHHADFRIKQKTSVSSKKEKKTETFFKTGFAQISLSAQTMRVAQTSVELRILNCFLLKTSRKAPV